MSRVSSKSGLSPSATRGSSAIDLGKDSGVDMGRKSQPSVSSGGIGITQEVANIGGVSVTGGVSVEVSPIRLDVSGHPNFEDPSKNSISVAGGAEFPGGILGVSGGAKINTSTGEIDEVSAGIEVAGIGISGSTGSEGAGLEITYQIPFTPIEISLGFGFPNEKAISPPTPSLDSPPPPQKPTKWTPPSGINIEKVRGCTLRFVWQENHRIWNQYGSCAQVESSPSPYPYRNNLPSKTTVLGRDCKQHVKFIPGFWEMSLVDITTKFECEVYWVIESWGNQKYLDDVLGYVYYYYIPDSYVSYDDPNSIEHGYNVVRQREVTEPSITVFNCNPSKVSDKIYVPNLLTATIPAPPLPNPPPRRKEMDTCCQENLKFLRAIYTKLGLAKFPGQLPATIIQEVEKEGQPPPEPPQVPIVDMVDLLDWQFRRDDERWGQWVVQIDVEDADLTKEGDQGKQIKFPNLAESIAELEGQMLSVMANVDALVAISTKNLVESGMARQEAIKGYLAAKAIIKYMAFKSTEIDVPVPMTFTAGAESISALIQESEGHIKGTDYVEKETLRDIMLDLLQAAAVIRAVHWQKIDYKNDTKSQLLSLLKGTVDLAGLVASGGPKKPDGEEKKFDPAQNFEDFIDSVEDGFRNTTGITDIQNPYGKTPDRRPRIRQIGDNISQAGGND